MLIKTINVSICNHVFDPSSIRNRDFIILTFAQFSYIFVRIMQRGRRHSTVPLVFFLFPGGESVFSMLKMNYLRMFFVVYFSRYIF